MTIELILFETIPGLGGLGEKVKVKRGYGRFLLSEEKAMRATVENLHSLDTRLDLLKKQAATDKGLAIQHHETLEALDAPIVIRVRATKDGKLFGSVTASEVLKALENLGVSLQKKAITFPEKQAVIHELGEYPIEVQLHHDIKLNLTIHVVADG